MLSLAATNLSAKFTTYLFEPNVAMAPNSQAKRSHLTAAYISNVILLSENIFKANGHFILIIIF